MKIFFLLALSLFFVANSLYALTIENYQFSDTSRHQPDSTQIKIKGSNSISGLFQSGNENRFVLSFLSDLVLGNNRFQVLPLTSVAYSSKPHAQVEGEYLENIIIRLNQQHIIYPALGFSAEKSFLRKIDYRGSAGITLVCNIIDKNQQSIKLGAGVNYETTQFVENAFQPVNSLNKNFNRQVEQIYVRLKGRNPLFNNVIVFSYDYFIQPKISDLNDYRWTLISNIDIPINKKFAFRVSSFGSYESFVAYNVHPYNFRLTYGINLSI